MYTLYYVFTCIANPGISEFFCTAEICCRISFGNFVQILGDSFLLGEKGKIGSQLGFHAQCNTSFFFLSILFILGKSQIVQNKKNKNNK